MRENPGVQRLGRCRKVTVIGTAPSHDGAVILDGSSVQCWVSTLSRRLRLNMSSLAVVCATTVTNYLDFARNCPARPCPICCRLSKYCFHRLMLARERRRSPRHFCLKKASRRPGDVSVARSPHAGHARTLAPSFTLPSPDAPNRALLPAGSAEVAHL